LHLAKAGDQEPVRGNGCVSHHVDATNVIISACKAWRWCASLAERQSKLIASTPLLIRARGQFSLQTQAKMEGLTRLPSGARHRAMRSCDIKGSIMAPIIRLPEPWSAASVAQQTTRAPSVCQQLGARADHQRDRHKPSGIACCSQAGQPLTPPATPGTTPGWPVTHRACRQTPPGPGP